MREPRAIRYFYNKEIADSACRYLQKESFKCYIKEDMFEKLTLDKVGMQRRFRLYVERDDINKIAEILAKKLRSRRILIFFQNFIEYNSKAYHYIQTFIDS